MPKNDTPPDVEVVEEVSPNGDVPAPPEQSQINGVVLHVEQVPGALPNVRLQLSGDVRLTEAETVMKLGLKELARVIGVS